MNAIDTARHPFQFAALREAGQDRVPDAQGTRLGRRHQAVILLGQGEQFV